MHCLKYFRLDTALCGVFIIVNISLEVWKLMVLCTKHKVVFLKGEKWSHFKSVSWLTGDICAHILTGKVIKTLVKQHIGLLYFLCNMEASNILKIINIPIYLSQCGVLSRGSVNNDALFTRRTAVGRLLAYGLLVLHWIVGTCAHVSSCSRSGWRSLSTSCSGKAVLRCVCAYASEGSQTWRSFCRTSDRWRIYRVISCGAAALQSPSTAFHIYYTYMALHDPDLSLMPS